MQVDAPPEENDASEEEVYIVENPTLVCNYLFNFKPNIIKSNKEKSFCCSYIAYVAHILQKIKI